VNPFFLTISGLVVELVRREVNKRGDVSVVGMVEYDAVGCASSLA
jgi:hypothetical protein